MTELDFYSIKCHEHDMTYGQYESAINNGLLPRPKMPAYPQEEPSKKPISMMENPTGEYFERTCDRCGQPFFVQNKKSRALYCPNCVNASRKFRHRRRTYADPRTKCKICGKVFDRGISKRGDINNRTMCSHCMNMWRGLSVEDKRIFAKDQTIERLEALRNGNKKNR